MTQAQCEEPSPVTRMTGPIDEGKKTQLVVTRLTQTDGR